MNPENQTREKLLQAAKDEFMEKGYATASLRNICKKAEVTTGALYFFFQDKEDLFGSLVREPLEKVYMLMKEHYKSEFEELGELKADLEKDKEAAQQVVAYMFLHYDVFVLLLMKSQGSKYENCMDEFVAITEQHYRILADRLSEAYHTKRLEDEIIHWISHIQIFSYAYFITHGLNREEALEQVKIMVEYQISGWFSFYKQGKPQDQ